MQRISAFVTRYQLALLVGMAAGLAWGNDHLAARWPSVTAVALPRGRMTGFATTCFVALTFALATLAMVVVLSSSAVVDQGSSRSGVSLFPSPCLKLRGGTMHFALCLTSPERDE